MGSGPRSLGPHEAAVVHALTARRAPAVTLTHVAEVVGDIGRARRLVARLVAGGWLQRVVRGRYVLIPAEWGPERIEDLDVHALASASVPNGYVGWWSAAQRHGFTTQVPHAIHVATDRRVAPRQILDTPVRYVALGPRRFFGWTETPSYGRTFRISTPEKTVIDCLDRPDLCGGPTELARIVHAAAGRLRPGDLVEAAVRHGSPAASLRLGFLLDMVAPGRLAGGTRERLRGIVPVAARTVIGHPHPRPGDIGRVAEWGVFANLREDDLLAEVPLAGAQADAVAP